MSVEKNKEVTRLTIEEVMNKSNLALIPELFAENYVHRAAAGPETRGHDGWRQNVLSAHSAFPDLHYTIDELVGEGDKVVCRATGTGTFKGTYMGVAPNGKRFSAGVMFVNTFEKGKIVETWAISNPLISLGQLGISPPGYVPSGEANKANERRLYEEVWNKGNLSLISELVSPDFVSGNNKGLDGYRQMVSGWRTAMPDVHFTIHEMVAEGDKVAYRVSATGTGAGNLGSVDVRGKKISGTMSIFTEYKGGKVAVGVAATDMLGLYRQAGVMPPGFAQTQEANKAVLKRYFEEVLNKGNVSLLDELMDENYVMKQPNGQEIRGRAGSKQYFSQMRSQFAPDIHVTIDEMVAEGDQVVVTGTWEGTQTGAFQGIPATGKNFKYLYSATYKVAGGKIASGRIVSDTMTLFQQLGVTPPAFAQTEEANKAVIRRTVEEIWNKGNVSLIPEQIAADYVAHNAGGTDYRGHDGFREMVTGTRAAFPDMRYAIDNLVCEGDKVVCNCTITGTNTGPMMGAPPTGKKISIKQTYISTVKDGKSVETWALADRLSLFQQLGITPPSTPTA